MNDDLTVRPYQEGDEEGIVSLLDLAFNGWPHFNLQCSPLDHWRWKFRDNFLRKTFCALAQSGEKIIACSHSIPVRVKIGENILLCDLGGDVAVHPDFRRLGLLKKIRNLKWEEKTKFGYHLSYQVTTNPLLFRCFMKVRTPFPRPVLNFVRILDIDSQLRSMALRNAWLIKLGFQGTRIVNYLRNLFARPQSGNRDFHIRPIKRFDDRIDPFWEEVSRHHDFIVARERDYLNWRYSDPRAGDFILKEAVGDDRVLGYSVLRLSRFGGENPIGFIIDLLALPDHPEVAGALVADAVDHFDSNRINLASCALVKSHPYEKILRRHGFLNSRMRIPVFFHFIDRPRYLPITKKIGEYSPDRVHFSYGDLDSLPTDIPPKPQHNLSFVLSR